MRRDRETYFQIKLDCFYAFDDHHGALVEQEPIRTASQGLDQKSFIKNGSLNLK